MCYYHMSFSVVRAKQPTYGTSLDNPFLRKHTKLYVSHLPGVYNGKRWIHDEGLRVTSWISESARQASRPPQNTPKLLQNDL
jgi:hypothetical protein